MTYKQMTKEIDDIKTQIDFLYRLRNDLFKGERDAEIMIGNIVNNLCAYQNYLRFTKEYEDKWLVEMKLRECKHDITEGKDKCHV